MTTTGTHGGRLLRPDWGPKSHIAFVSTYPPAICGLATFTSSLRGAIAAKRGTPDGLDVIALAEDGAPDRPQSEVLAYLDPSDAGSIRRAAALLADHDAVVLQHEYGIWGPEMGLAVLDFVEQLESPLITTLHTLLSHPTPTQRMIIERLARHSERLVVPTLAAARLLTAAYDVDGPVMVIPHGTAARHVGGPARLRDRRPVPDSAPRLLTWGLIGPGKGLEWSVEAMARVAREHPRLRYTIAGRTHPKVMATEGERYRRGLHELADRLGLARNVEFIDEYLPEWRIHDLLRDATMVVLPYDSTEQMVSGVLVEAVSAQVPVVATAFPHAVELASQEAVATVPHRDSDAMAEAVVSLLDSPAALARMRRAQERLAARSEWSSVAGEYDRLIESISSGRGALRHVPPAS